MNDNKFTKKIIDVLSAILCGPPESPFHRISNAIMECFDVKGVRVERHSGETVCATGIPFSKRFSWCDRIDIGNEYVVMTWADKKPDDWSSGFVDVFPEYVSGMVPGLNHSMSTAMRNSFYSVVKEGLCICDLDGTIKSANPAMRSFLGLTESDFPSCPVFDLVHHEDREMVRKVFISMHTGKELRFDCRIMSDMTEVWLDWSMVLFSWNGKKVVYASARDITDRKNMESYVTHVAHHDALTSLPNRCFLEDELHSRIYRAKRNGNQVVIMFVDLDKFKHVNDTLGHRIGDLLLCEVANRLKVAIRGEDHVARQGGDEFIIVADGNWTRDSANEYACRIREVIRNPFSILGRTCSIDASIGVAIYPNDGESPEALVNRADKAMYKVKNGEG